MKGFEFMKNNVRVACISAAVTIFFVISFLFGVFHGNLKGIIKLNKVMQIINNEFYFDIDENKMVDYALAGMAMSTGDRYTNYYPSEQFENYVSNGENSYIGVGLVLGISEDNEHLEVISVMDNSPGMDADICPGDLILEINGHEMSADDLNLAAKYMRGEDGSTGGYVNLKIQSSGKVFEANIERRSIEKDTVKSKMLSDDIGYIRISAFDRRAENDKNSIDTYDEFCGELNALREIGAKKLVLDLRNNPGGDLSVVSKIADYILPEGVITYTETKSGTRSYIYSDEASLDMDMVVLVNGNSASASEVLTAAIKDYKKGAIVGTTTYGKGIVQSIYNFSDGSGMSITTSQYFSPNGTAIHKIGIKPDYEIALSEEAERNIADLSYDEDTQLQKAVEILNK